jgi:DNA-binding NarL/FixJ family response regulator
MTRPRILIADAHRLFREAFAKLLEPECDVVGAIADSHALLTEAPELQPDIILLDVTAPTLNGLDMLGQLRQLMPRVRIIFLIMSEDPELAAEAFRLGASAYLLKDSAASELLQAVREVSLGHSYITPLAAQGLVENLLQASAPKNKHAKLSERHREVLQLLAEGCTMKEIGRRLNITPRTVAFHKYNMMELLKISSSAQLIQYAVKQHLVPM